MAQGEKSERVGQDGDVVGKGRGQHVGNGDDAAVATLLREQVASGVRSGSRVALSGQDDQGVCGADGIA